MASLLTSRPKLTGAISLLALGGLTFYITKKQLNKACPRVPITQLPASSACRNFLESGVPSSEKPWGTDKSVLISSWSGRNEEKKTCWMPSFVALQVDVSIAQLEQHHQRNRGNEDSEKTKDTYPLAQNFMRAFLHGRAKGPERLFLDRDVPPFSYLPGTHLFGRRDFGAFMLGSWGSKRGIPFTRPDLPTGLPLPPSEFPSNADAIARAHLTSEIESDAAGTVIYWTFPPSLINTVNKPAAFGSPWRLMHGGFQEFIVQRVSEETARVTYVTLECSDLYPASASFGGGDGQGDFKKLPWWFYELHVLYAQALLWRALRQVRT